MSALVYHYTTCAHHLPKILATGELRPNKGDFEQSPLLWFSRHQHWEVTAAGMLPLPTPGYVRFSLPADDPRLMDWPKACRYAGITSSTRRQLESIGIHCGASPADWLAIASAVSLADVHLQQFDGAAWVDLTEKDAQLLGGRKIIPMAVLKPLAKGPWEHDDFALTQFSSALKLHRESDVKQGGTCTYSMANDSNKDMLTTAEFEEIIKVGAIDPVFHGGGIDCNQYWLHSLMQFYAECTKAWAEHEKRTQSLLGTPAGKIWRK